VEDVQVALVELNLRELISQDGVRNMVGIKIVADVLYHMKVEEMLMLCFSIQTDLMMLDSGKLMISIGVNAMEEIPHAI
jgi:hypothetical protein